MDDKLDSELDGELNGDLDGESENHRIFRLVCGSTLFRSKCRRCPLALSFDVVRGAFGTPHGKPSSTDSRTQCTV